MKKNGNFMDEGPVEKAFGGEAARMVRARPPLELELLIWSAPPWEGEGWVKCYTSKPGRGPCVLSICRMAPSWEDGGPFGCSLLS